MVVTHPGFCNNPSNRYLYNCYATLFLVYFIISPSYPFAFRPETCEIWRGLWLLHFLCRLLPFIIQLFTKAALPPKQIKNDASTIICKLFPALLFFKTEYKFLITLSTLGRHHSSLFSSRTNLVILPPVDWILAHELVDVTTVAMLYFRLLYNLS